MLHATKKCWQSTQIMLSGLAVFVTAPMLAQTFPTFPAGTANSSITLESGTGGSFAPVGNSVYPNAYNFVYTNANQNMDVAYTLDGRTYSIAGTIDYDGITPEEGCGRGYPDDCIPAAAAVGTNLYVAFVANSCDCLYVLKGVRIPGNVFFTWSVAYTNTAQTLSSAPAMAITPDSHYLVIRYGTTNENATYSTTLNISTGAWNTYVANGYAPTRSALVSFSGSLYAIDKQNNSDNGVFVSKLNDNGIYIPGTSYQVSGWTTLRGLSATVWNGELVVVDRVNSGSNTLQIHVSTNGSTWSGQTYSGHTGGGDYAAATFNNGTTTGVAIAVVANDPSDWLYGNFGT